MFKRLIEWVSGVTTAWGLLPSTVATYVTTFAWVAVMTAAGYLEQVPVFWIMMGLPLAAAAIFTLVLRASEWKMKTSPEGKFLFHGLMLGADYTKNAKGKIQSITAAQVRLLLQSTASFPISFVVDELLTSFEDEFPPNKPKADNGAVAKAHELKSYVDNLIELKNTSLRETVKGTTKFKLRYGRVGREKFHLQHNLIFEAKFEEQMGGYVIFQHKETA